MYFPVFKQKILSLPEQIRYERADLLTDAFLLEEENRLQIYYAPHNEYFNPGAKVVIVGICPGWTQMELSYRVARAGLHEGIGDEKILQNCKSQARFAAGMRKNLIEMLDELQLGDLLGVSSSSQLFLQREELLHTTSLIPYPVFVRGKNYTGSNPPLSTSPILARYMQNTFLPEVERMEHRALYIALGVTVEQNLRQLVSQGLLSQAQCLFGFPHPSGANAHRFAQFAQNREILKKRMSEWAAVHLAGI